jgi:hypothetical protein
VVLRAGVPDCAHRNADRGTAGVYQVRPLLTGRGAAMAMDENGIAIRRSISSSIDRLPWPDISYFGLKSVLHGTYLVIYLKNPEAIIAKQGVITRWFMGQSLNMFGSPVRIPLFALKCDQNWLVQTADALRRKYNPNRDAAPRNFVDQS